MMYFILQHQRCSPFDSIKCVCEQGQIGDLAPFGGSRSYCLQSSALTESGQDKGNLSSLKGLCLLLPTGSHTQEGRGPGGSAVWNATQQPGERMGPLATRAPHSMGGPRFLGVMETFRTYKSPLHEFSI